MLLHPRCAVAALFAAAGLPSALGQVPAPAASAPVAVYRSAFEGYRRFSDAPLLPWRASNDRVAAIGGWKAYAREAAGPDTSEGLRPEQAQHPSRP